MMKRTSVLDFLGVVRIVGYSLAIVPALIAVVLYLIGHWWPLAGFIVAPFLGPVIAGLLVAWIAWLSRMRSEEHTSELQSLMRISYAVFCLKKKKQCNTNK